jgi:hypothetical protein
MSPCCCSKYTHAHTIKVSNMCAGPFQKFPREKKIANPRPFLLIISLGRSHKIRQAHTPISFFLQIPHTPICMHKPAPHWVVLYFSPSPAPSIHLPSTNALSHLPCPPAAPATASSGSPSSSPPRPGEIMVFFTVSLPLRRRCPALLTCLEIAPARSVAPSPTYPQPRRGPAPLRLSPRRSGLVWSSFPNTAASSSSAAYSRATQRRHRWMSRRGDFSTGLPCTATVRSGDPHSPPLPPVVQAD